MPKFSVIFFALTAGFWQNSAEFSAKSVGIRWSNFWKIRPNYQQIRSIILFIQPNFIVPKFFCFFRTSTTFRLNFPGFQQFFLNFLKYNEIGERWFLVLAEFYNTGEDLNCTEQTQGQNGHRLWPGIPLQGWKHHQVNQLAKLLAILPLPHLPTTRRVVPTSESPPSLSRSLCEPTPPIPRGTTAATRGASTPTPES
jgi:hypothetical protein